MPRELPPEGEWVTVPVRVRRALLDRIDVARGDVNRSAWFRNAAEAAVKPVRQECPPDLPPPVVPAAGTSPVAPQRCGHAGVRVTGGWCAVCQHKVLPGGKWEL